MESAEVPVGCAWTGVSPQHPQPYPGPENDFGPENRPEESTPRWVDKPFEGQEHAFELLPLAGSSPG